MATTLVTMTPEEYYDIAHEKDPAVGAVAGGALGGLAGAIRGSKGGRSRAALIGTALGAASGASTGALAGKALKRYQTKKLRNLTEQLHLRTTPGKKRDK